MISLTLEHFVRQIALEQPDRSRIAFICIGSDRSTGDSYGPIVGTLLQKRGWGNIIGTLQQPCDAYKVEEAVGAVDPTCTVIAIDACLGNPKTVGQYVLTKGSLLPGAAIGRRLPPVGHYSIAGIVNMNGPKAYAMLQTTSLYQVICMAEHTVEAIDAAWTNEAKDQSLNG